MHLFYQPNENQLFLDGEEARHCSRVLRLSVGDTIEVTDGRGRLHKATLTSVKEKQVQYQTLETRVVVSRPYRVNIAVAPTRKAERNEWMVEKMTELGIDGIHFVITEHTHHETVRRVVNAERLERIAVSAMKQSRQMVKPVIEVHNDYAEYLHKNRQTNSFIAYVTDTAIPEHLVNIVVKNQDTLVLIGPEGDFSEREIELALSQGFVPVSLGSTRLRTETAAVMACHSVHLAQLL